MCINQERDKGKPEQALEAGCGSPQALQSPELTSSFLNEGILVRNESRQPILDGQAGPRSGVPSILSNIPVAAAAGKHTVLKPQLNVVCCAIFYRLLNLDGVSALIHQRLDESASRVVDLHFASVQSRVVGWEGVWSEPVLVLAKAVKRSCKRAFAKTYRIAMFGKLWTKVPKYA